MDTTMKPLVKICGMTNLQDALFCAPAGADALGFIFYKKSPRYIEPSKAAGIIKLLPPSTKPIGVFVNEQRETIESIVRLTRLHGIQLSGDEPPADCEGYSVPVWKVFRIRDMRQVKNVKPYAINAAMLDGASGAAYGGSGTLADFSVAIEMKKYHPLILAGGLGPDNILNAIGTVRPYAVDVNSSVELAPGKKDPNKVNQLFTLLQA